MRQAGAVQQEKNSDKPAYSAQMKLAVPVVLPEIIDWLPDRLKEELTRWVLFVGPSLDAYSKVLERLRVVCKVVLSASPAWQNSLVS